MAHLSVNEPYMQKPERSGYEKLVVLVAKAYLILLPIRMIAPLLFLQDYLGVTANYFDLVLHLMGLILIVLGSRGVIQIGKDKTSRLFHYFVLMIVWFNLSSVVMAIVMQSVHGNIGNESAFSGIAGMLVYFTQYVFIVFYNKEIFRYITKEEIIGLLNKLVLFLFILGYFQIAVMVSGGLFASLYDKLDILDIVRNSEKLPKLCLTGSEGASAGTLIGTFVFPFIMAKVFVQRKWLKNIIFLLAWLPVVYFTYSSTAYILIAIDILVFCLFYMIKVKRGIDSIVMGLLFSIGLIAVLLFPVSFANLLPSDVGEKVEYLLTEKATDKANGSTVSRLVPLYVNWGAFMEYPILGVGNGNQGYFYEKYFPEFAWNVAGSDASVFLERSRGGISNGGVFIPSLLSGYGIVGVIWILIYIMKCLRHVKSNRNKLGLFYYMFHISWIAILVTGLQGDFVGNYYLWFLLSIPFMAYTKTNQTTRIQVEK